MSSTERPLRLATTVFALALVAGMANAATASRQEPAPSVPAQASCSASVTYKDSSGKDAGINIDWTIRFNVEASGCPAGANCGGQFDFTLRFKNPDDGATEDVVRGGGWENKPASGFIDVESYSYPKPWQLIEVHSIDEKPCTCI
jgi:hypothetical protein